MSIKTAPLVIVLLGGFIAAGCANTAAGVQEDAARAGKTAATAASDATAATKDAASTAGAAVAAAIETIDVKSALMADRTVDASSINVDTIHDPKTVVLKGSVPSASQREEAGRIAAAEAPGYRIDNQLAVVTPR